MSALREALRDLPDAVFADLLESEDDYLLVVDLPGVTRETVDVTVEDRQVRIEARREKAVPTEYRYVREDRSLFLDAELPLPPDAASEGAAASMERGVLSLRIPRRASDEGTRIEIREEGEDPGDDATTRRDEDGGDGEAHDEGDGESRDEDDGGTREGGDGGTREGGDGGTRGEGDDETETGNGSESDDRSDEAT